MTPRTPRPSSTLAGPSGLARLLAFALSVAFPVAVAACDDDDAPPPPADGSLDAGIDAGPVDGGSDFPATRPPPSELLEPGVRREYFLVPGVVPPPNPATGAATPAELDFTQVVRYREDATPARPAAAILIAYPGTFGGAASWDRLARDLVRRGATAGRTIEFWAIDRRSNLLEDLRGMDAAQAEGDPEIAQGYYFGGDTVGGTRFGGHPQQEDVSFMSEWGLPTLLGDLRAVVHVVPEAERRGRVFLLGHSAGAGVVETYAAWRFGDGESAVRGAEEVAGIVLVDGAAGAEPIAERDYRMGTTGGLMALTGVDALRMRGPRYVELPVLGVNVMVTAEIMSLRALAAPDGVVADGQRDRVLSILWSIGRGEVPRLTNEAALGAGFDQASNGIPVFSCNLGQPAGGPTAMKTGLFGPLTYPSDPSATYTWIDALEATPPEYTPVAALARSWAAGRTNYADWFYPARLPLDQQAVGGNAIPEDGWQVAYGLRAFDGPRNDAPVLAVAAGLVPPDRYEAVRARIAAEIGAGRPQAGARRGAAGESTPGFRVLDVTYLTHLDALAAPEPGNPVAGAVTDFVAEHGVAGAIALTPPGT
jgi:hypothetical protein